MYWSPAGGGNIIVNWEGSLTVEKRRGLECQREDGEIQQGIERRRGLYTRDRRLFCFGGMRGEASPPGMKKVSCICFRRHR